MLKRVQILLDADQHSRLRRESSRAGRSVGALVRDAVDRVYPPAAARRARAAAAKELFSLGLPVDDWPRMKRRIVDSIGRDIT